MGNFYYYGRFKNKTTNVIQNDVSHFKTKVLHIRADSELDKNLVDLAKELNQDKSKVARDILQDFFLEQNTRNWAKEVNEMYER